MRYPVLASALFFLLAAADVALAEGPSQSGCWPQWRGPNRDGVSQETGLLKEWPEGGPRLIWQVDAVGAGYSSVIIQGDRIYTQGDLDGVEHTIALNAADGSVVWAVQPVPVAELLDQRMAEELKRLDTDADGTIDEAEALARLGWSFNQFDASVDGDRDPIAAQRAARLLKKLDKDGDRRLTFAEAGGAFRDPFANIDSADATADAEALAQARTDAFLKLADKDQDSRVSRQEAQGTLLDRPFGQIDQKDPTTNKGDEQLTADEIRAYLLKSEGGLDGLLSASELAAYYARALAGKDGLLTAGELRSYYGGFREGHGDGPRGTPTLDGDRLYVEGGHGDLACLEAATGRTVWYKSLERDLKGGMPGWGYCESPLVVGDWVIVTPGGGEGTVAALDKRTGEVVWRSSGITEGAHYSSPVLAEIAGVRQVVQFASQNVFGVRLSDGQLLWKYDRANNGTANCATPIVSQDHVFASSSYGKGGGLAHILASGDGQQAEEVYFEPKMANHHGGIVLVGDHMYGFGNGGLICMDFLTGETAWVDHSVGKGSLICADGMLYCLSEGYEVALVEANPAEYVEHGRFKIDNLGRPSWAHPVVAGGRFYIRNQQRLAAYDVSSP